MLSTVLIASIIGASMAQNGYESIAVMHGSGTTNPSKLLWKALDLLEERSRIPVHATYRAIGSGGGQAEFIGADNGYAPYNHFGSGDITVSASDYNDTKNNGRTFLHIPFVVGGIGIFHSIPVGDGQEVRLDGCLLAKIFQRNITKWDDAAIAAQNSDSVNEILKGKDIQVVRRKLGSSSTSLTTSYLKQVCPNVWTIGVGKGGDGKAPFWPADTNIGQGSGGITKFLNDNPFSIGYIDAGHGHDSNLNEVALKNFQGDYLKSDAADLSAAAADDGVGIPSDMTADWSQVNLLNADAKNAWPIVTFSYIYVDTDLSQYGVSGALTKALLQMLLSDEFQNSESGHLLEFGFVPIGDDLLTRCKQAVDAITTNSNIGEFQFEVSTTVGAGGAGANIISVKRNRWNSYLLNDLVDTVATNHPEDEHDDDHHDDDENTTTVAAETSTTKSSLGSSDDDDDDDDNTIGIVAIVLGALALLLGLINLYLVNQLRNASSTGGMTKFTNNPSVNEMSSSSV